MRMLKSHKGLSLIEVTIMLLVLMLLTSVLAPSIFDFIKDAQRVKVKEDCEAIALSIARLFRDTNCIAYTGTSRPVDCEMSNIPGLLFSDGTPATIAGGPATAWDEEQGSTTDCAAYDWDPNGACTDSLEDQLVTNDPRYKTPAELGFAQNPLPLFNTGWRGAYLASPIGPDPWGNAYMVNSLFLKVADDATATCAGGNQGCQDTGWDYDTICLSAGENGIVETPFASVNSGTDRGGDDFITVISGGTR